ncbi:hypothetical protein GRAN_1072 [Granulicella sibirica]|uniref:Uncharacterized protein n=1 Tax=Granulicella sibirica TaxID=2479048 RepID=A0A4Q0T499_9BACT|nr:hypothetical protein GRAN_1072 [Granulicella sibirica]
MAFSGIFPLPRECPPQPALRHEILVSIVKRTQGQGIR